MSTKANIKQHYDKAGNYTYTSWTVIPGTNWYDCECCGYSQHEDLLEERDGYCTDCDIYCWDAVDEEVHGWIAKEREGA